MKKTILLWVFSVILIACGRPSAKERLENITEITLPADYEVLSNSHQQMGKDFFIQYDIQFTPDSTQQMIEQIRSSKFYSKAGAQTLYDSIWYEDQNLYKFDARSETGDKKYAIVFNPSSGFLSYTEYSERMKL